MNVLRAVELRGAAGADAIGAQGLDSLFFYRFAGIEVIEVVRRKVGHSPAVRELDLGARWSVHQGVVSIPSHYTGDGRIVPLPNHHRDPFGLVLLEDGLVGNEGLRLPVPDELVDLILSELDVIGAVGGIRGRQQVSHEEYDEDQFDGRPDGVVLVARLDVSGQDGTTGDSLESLEQAMHRGLYIGLGIVEIHGSRRVRVTRCDSWGGGMRGEKRKGVARGCEGRIYEVLNSRLPSV